MQQKKREKSAEGSDSDQESMSAILAGSDVSASDGDVTSTSWATSRCWAPSDFSEESDVCDVSGATWSDTFNAQIPCKASASRSRTPSPLGTTAALPNATARPMTPHLAQLHDDLCKFHATHGDDAIPKRSKDVTPEEFSLANRLESYEERNASPSLPETRHSSLPSMKDMSPRQKRSACRGTLPISESSRARTLCLGEELPQLIWSGQMRCG